jgi:hypothetical protein
MTIDEIRRANLLALIDERSFSDFAAELDLDASYLSQIKTRHRTMGKKFARKIEDKLKLPGGWMDAAHLAGEGNEAGNLPLVVEDPSKLALLALFDALPKSEQVALLADLEEKKRRYDKLWEEMSEQRKMATK